MSKAIVIDIGERRTPIYERVRTADGNGWTSRQCGTRVGRLTMTIDPDKIPHHKIVRALLAKGHKTVTNGGLVVLTASQMIDQPLEPKNGN